MFIDNLITAMTGDTSVNTLATGGIVYEHLPVDFDQTKRWVVFSYSSSGNTDVLSTVNVISEYELQVQVIAPEITDVLNISDYLTTYLLSYNGTNIKEITLADDDININTEKNVYYKTINYNVININ